MKPLKTETTTTTSGLLFSLAWPKEEKSPLPGRGGRQSFARSGRGRVTRIVIIGRWHLKYLIMSETCEAALEVTVYTFG